MSITNSPSSRLVYYLNIHILLLHSSSVHPCVYLMVWSLLPFWYKPQRHPLPHTHTPQHARAHTPLFYCPLVFSGFSYFQWFIIVDLYVPGLSPHATSPVHVLPLSHILTIRAAVVFSPFSSGYIAITGMCYLPLPFYNPPRCSSLSPHATSPVHVLPLSHILTIRAPVVFSPFSSGFIAITGMFYTSLPYSNPPPPLQ